MMTEQEERELAWYEAESTFRLRLAEQMLTVERQKLVEIQAIRQWEGREREE